MLQHAVKNPCFLPWQKCRFAGDLAASSVRQDVPKHTPATPAGSRWSLVLESSTSNGTRKGITMRRIIGDVLVTFTPYGRFFVTNVDVAANDIDLDKRSKNAMILGPDDPTPKIIDTVVVFNSGLAPVWRIAASKDDDGKIRLHPEIKIINYAVPDDPEQAAIAIRDASRS